MSIKVCVKQSLAMWLLILLPYTTITSLISRIPAHKCNWIRNVALICDEKEITKIVFTSSVAVYGFAGAGADEDGAINPFNEYGRTK